LKVLLLGTSSGAGKTTVSAMLCRYFSRNGVKTVPFKGSNLSLNSYATADGGEIGMGQAFQSWACGVEPCTDMNPLLLKPCGDGVIQVVVDGQPYMDMSKDVPMDREYALPRVGAAFHRLEDENDLVVCEGSGSPVEINIMHRDVANIWVMRELQIPSIIVGDIERGGVFAAIYGTWRLIPDDLKHLMKGFVINRFRGDGSILGPGIKRIEELTGMKCLGVLPYEDLRFPEEDSLSSSSGSLEGDDIHAAFISNLDKMVDDAVDSGFDFDGVMEIARG